MSTEVASASAAPASAAKSAPAPAKAAAPAKAPAKETKAAAPAKAPAKAAPAKTAPAKTASKAPEKKAEPPKPVAKFAAARQLVSVFNKDGKEGKSTIKMPNVLLAPIRHDIVRFVHTSMAKNRRQAYAVSEGAGHQHSAESWGTGRAVARIPRVSGGGTSRAGQGAFGNQCRAGRMFAPTKTWRKWHRKINTNQKRYAVASALAASASVSLVQARGHRIDEVPQVPLVLESAIESIEKTKDAVGVLEAVSATSDVDHARNSRKLRRGKGKMRNRRHVQRRGPLVIYNEDKGITRAFRNLPGVELCHVERLNLLQLAPGGHLGRFIVWTQSAFARLDDIWGSTTRASAVKKGYTLPYNIMLQSDLPRLINSEEVQTKVRPAIKTVKTARTKKNPLTNLGVMVHLNPYALALKRSQLLTEERRAKHRAAIVAAKRAGPRPDGKKADVPYTFDEKTRRAADSKHGKAHNQLKNYSRIAGVGKAEPKLEQPKMDVAKMQAENDAAAKALEKKDAPKKVEKTAPAKAPAAKTTDGKAAATDAKAAKGGDAKGKDGEAKAKGGDGGKKEKGGEGKKEKGGDAGKKEKGGDAGKKGGEGGKKGGEKKGGDAKKA